MTSGPSELIASAPRTELETLFAFLGRIRDDAGLREQINWMQTVLEVSELAGGQGQAFRPELLVAVLESCNEAPYAREGLMDEKLIRVHLRRDNFL
ncbi:hypothetical protein NZK33_12295 [Cyanobium sp. FGCU-6]|jgi:hypothetical protein|nr:hypothetical protein [Cyanobium sp. FGCU6]